MTYVISIKIIYSMVNSPSYTNTAPPHNQIFSKCPGAFLSNLMVSGPPLAINFISFRSYDLFISTIARAAAVAPVPHAQVSSSTPRSQVRIFQPEFDFSIKLTLMPLGNSSAYRICLPFSYTGQVSIWLMGSISVSYTHLDVYKRQGLL